MQFKSAAIIVPNNDFLVEDTAISSDLRLVTRSVNDIGYNIEKISVVEEVEKAVAFELTILSRLHDVVIVLAKPNPKCVSVALGNITMQEFEYATPTHSAEEITWPKSLKIIKSETGLYPILYFQRIFILQFGMVHQQLQLILETHLSHYIMKAVYSKIFRLTKNGVQNYLENVSVDNVKFGYEQSGSEDLITIASSNFENVVNAEVLFREKYSNKIKNGYWTNGMVDLIYDCNDRHIKLAIEVIEKCLNRYGLENVFLSFNGGKDCTVLLHLVQTVIEKLFGEKKKHIKLFCLYVRSANAFKEQDEFIYQCNIFFNLEILTVNGNIKDALRNILEEHPNFKACFMGTRRTDPYSSHLNVFEITDPGWPQVMRCNPLLDWYYSDIWDYLLYYKVPYCKLYDYGYTSLGNTSNTIRNPSLFFNDFNKDTYLPAYKMMIDKKERSGRNISKM